MSEKRRQFISVARQVLLHQLMSGWHRRGATLLQVGLRAGFSPEFFWEAGFDVTALDASEYCLEAAHAQTGSRVAYRLGNPGYLPFEDGEFDYVVLIHCGIRRKKKERFAPLEEDAPEVLLEARRVGTRGIAILEWNRCSLAGVPTEASRVWHPGHVDVMDRAAPSSGVSASMPREAEGVLPWELYSLVRGQFRGMGVSFRSSMLLGESTWPESSGALPSFAQRMLVPVNLHPSFIPFGALLGLRVDWTPIPLTPVGMLRSAAASPC